MQPVTEKCVVIVSGGMDSVTLLHLAVREFGKDNVHAISFHYAQKHAVEIGYATTQCQLLKVRHSILKLDVLKQIAPNSALTSDSTAVPVGHYADDSMKLTVVPNRNMVMLSLAISFAITNQAHNVWYGAHSGDHTIYPDCRPEFVSALATAANLCDWFPVLLAAPFLAYDKGMIVNLGLKLGVDYARTWTCYNGDDTKGACGKCGSCTERLEAFAVNGITDPCHYEGRVR